MNGKTYKLVKPAVSYSMYWIEGVLLLLSVATPVIVWVIWDE